MVVEIRPLQRDAKRITAAEMIYTRKTAGYNGTL